MTCWSRPTLVRQADGVRRYQYNPRIMEAARLIPKGDIYDRNGLRWQRASGTRLEQHRGGFEALGVAVDRNVSKSDRSALFSRGAAFLFAWRSRRIPLKQGASNTAFQERASRIRLQGYDDEPEAEAVEDPETGEMIRRVSYDYSELIRWCGTGTNPAMCK